MSILIRSFLLCLPLLSPLSGYADLVFDPPLPAAADKTTEKTTDTVETLRKAAVAAMISGKWEQALDIWQQLLVILPDDNQALRLRGSVYAELGRFSEAQLDHARAIELEPESANAWNSRCWGRILAGQFSAARADCERSLTLYPEHFATLINLAHTHLLAGDSVTAWAIYAQAIPFLDDEAELQSGPLADFDLFKQRGWRSDRIDAERDRFAAQARDWLTRRTKSDALLAQAKVADAAKDWTHSIRLRSERLSELETLLAASHPLVIRAADALADTYTQSGQPDKALPLYLRVFDHRRKLTGERAKPLLITISDLLTTIKAIDQPRSTSNVLEALLPVIEREWGVDSKIAIQLAERLAAALMETKSSPIRVLELAERVAAYQERTAAPVLHHLNSGLQRLWALSELNAHSEAIEVLEGMRRRVETGPDANTALFNQFTETQGDLYALGKQPDQAIARYQQVLDARQGEDEATLTANLETLQKIVELLAYHNRAAEAQPYQEKARLLAERRSGKDNKAGQ
jgi:tetratricopeptide (TPR) repeat protein